MSNTFQSFIWKKDKEVAATATVNEAKATPARTLLPGEVGGISCDDVAFCFQFHSAQNGRLTCTNFCLYLEPVVTTSSSRVPSRSTVVDEEYCVPLCAIENIYWSPLHHDIHRSASKKKFRRLTASVSSLEIVSCLKIYLKDFRVLSLDMSRSQHAPNMANQLLFFSRPPSISHLVQAGAKCEWIGRVGFNDEDAWRQELNRCCAQKEGWRVCGLRKELLHCVVHSYPMYVVVPRDIVAHDLGQMVEHWAHGRFPVWVWSSSNGTSLLRSSKFEENWMAPKLNNKYLSAVPSPQHSHGAAPQQITIESSVTAGKIAASYQKLHKLCSIDSRELLATREKDWLSRLQDTGWPRLVLYCMQTAAHTITWMLDRGRSVVVCEEIGTDVSAVVSSLVQICCDPYFRTATGLEQLISKEWIALGHPFGERLLGMGTTHSATANGPATTTSLEREMPPTTPTFLLFLDAVAQLRRLYPMQFNYSDHLLIALWDLALTGFVPAFACSSVNEQLATGKTGGPFPLGRFLSEEYRRLFSNVVNDAAQVVQQANRKHANTGFLRGGEVPQPLLCDVIRPPTTPVDLELWELCYGRWTPPVNVRGGGEVVRDIALDTVMTTVADRNNLFWKQQFAGIEAQNLSSAYPYSLPDAEPRRLSDLLDETDDAISVHSMSSLSIRNKPRGSIALDSSHDDSFSLEHRTSFSVDPELDDISLRPADDRAIFRTPVRNAPPPPRAESKPALRPLY